MTDKVAAEGLVSSPASQKVDVGMCVTCGHDLATHDSGSSQDGCRFKFGWGHECECGWPVAAEVSSPARPQLEELFGEWDKEVYEHGLWTSGHSIAARIVALLRAEWAVSAAPPGLEVQEEKDV